MKILIIVHHYYNNDIDFLFHFRPVFHQGYQLTHQTDNDDSNYQSTATPQQGQQV